MTDAAAATVRGDYLLYDGECPVCANYVAWTGLRTAHPGIALVDARAEPALVAALRAEGIEVNDTMVLQVGEERLVGAEAMARISSYMPGDTGGQRVLKGLTRSRRLLGPVYPLLVRGRKLLLAVLGRRRIE